MKNKKTVLISALAGVGLLGGGFAAVLLPSANADRSTPPPTAQEAHDLKVAPTEPGSGDSVDVAKQDQVIKALGEAGELTTADGKSVFSITVKSVKAMKSCTIRGFGTTVTPENGTFLVLEVEASMAASANDLVEETTAAMPLDAAAFGVATTRETPAVTGLNTELAAGCELENPLDFQVEGGHTTRGQAVLDSPIEHGQLTYSPEGEGGWVWAF